MSINKFMIITKLEIFNVFKCLDVIFYNIIQENILNTIY